MNPYNVGTVREGKDLIEKALGPLSVASRKLYGNFKGYDQVIYDLHERLHADLQDLREIHKSLKEHLEEYDEATGVKKELMDYTFEEKEEKPRRTKVGSDPILDLMMFWEYEVAQLHPLSQEEREKIIDQFMDACMKEDEE